MISINALKVNQWLEEWDQMKYGETYKSKPKPFFYTFSIKASLLKKLSGIQRRSEEPASRKDEIGIQRKHDENRSLEIKEFVHKGYPWSDLSTAKKEDPEYKSLQKPGWLPTAIVVNILEKDDERRNLKVKSDEVIQISNIEDNLVKLHLPEGCGNDNWQPSEYVPIEVIDGQHRLWAFDENIDFEIPVVAYHGLDISWQAYLFYVINIKPKKIDRSLAFDMYPLLRDEDWLKPTHDYIVYRETRAQELVEILWAHPNSTWYKKISMLGGTRDYVSQNAWVNSLTSTFIKSNNVKGLFSSTIPFIQRPLEWGTSQHAAFILYLWKELETNVKNNKEKWTERLRDKTLFPEEAIIDNAFHGKETLLNSDQGVRGVLSIFNDLFFEKVEFFKLDNWDIDIQRHSNIEEYIDNVNEAIVSLKEMPFKKFIDELALIISTFDWRSSKADLNDLTEEQKLVKKTFRGSGGYKELKKQLLLHIKNSSSSIFTDIAKKHLEQMS